MHQNHYSKTMSEQPHSALTECTFLYYQAGRLDGFDLGYRQGVTDRAESNAARAENAARVFYAMTAEDVDRRRFAQIVSTAFEVTEARREAGEWAAKNCAYAGGPVDFWTGRPMSAEGRGDA